MADDYATWRPQAEADWTPEDYEKLRMDRDVWQARFERLGAAGEVYVAELRDEIKRLRSLLNELLVNDGDVAVRYDGFDCYYCGGLGGHKDTCVIPRAQVALVASPPPAPGDKNQ